MDQRRTAGALLALAACIACISAAPTITNETAIDSYDGSSGCYYNFQHYGEGDRIMTNEPCLNCTCHNRMLMCYLRVCPFTKPIGQDCTIEKRADQCCPIITCPDVPVDLLTSTSTTSPAEYGANGVGHLDRYGCSIHDKYYPEGAKVPPTPNKPCEHCYCIRNMTTCVMQECTLNVAGCTPIYHKDVCCPVRYSCDHPEDTTLMLDHITTTVGTTPGIEFTTTAAPSVTQDCIHGDDTFPDGALIKTEKACEHCYCMKGDIVCVVQECGTPMENEGKNCTSLPPREGQCCPDTYICEGDNEITTDEITTMKPPRRVGEEGSGYRKEGDQPVTEEISYRPDHEGSGESTYEPTYTKKDFVPYDQVTEAHPHEEKDVTKEHEFPAETSSSIPIDEEHIEKTTLPATEIDQATTSKEKEHEPSEGDQVPRSTTSSPKDRLGDLTIATESVEHIEVTIAPVVSEEKEHTATDTYDYELLDVTTQASDDISKYPSELEKDHKPEEYTTLAAETDETVPVTTQSSDDVSKYPSEIEKDHKPDESTTFKPDTDEKVPVTTQASDDVSKYPSELEKDHKLDELSTIEPETDEIATVTTQASDDVSKYPSEIEKDHKPDESTTFKPDTDEKVPVTTQASDDVSKYPSELEKDHKLDELSTIEPETDEKATVTTQTSDDISKYPSEIEKDHKPDESTTFKPDTDEKVPVTTQASDDVSKYPSELEKDHKLDELSTIEPETDEKATVTTQASDDISKYPSELEKDHKLDGLTTIESETDEKVTVTTQAYDDISKYPSGSEKDHKSDESTTFTPKTDERLPVTTQASEDSSKYPFEIEKDHKPDESTTFKPDTDEKVPVTTQASDDVSKYPSELEKDHKLDELTTIEPETDEKVTVTTQASDDISKYPSEIEKDHKLDELTTIEPETNEKVTVTTQGSDDISKYPSELEKDHKLDELTTIEPQTDEKSTVTTQASDDISKYPSELEKDHKLDGLTTIELETDEIVTVTTQAYDDISKYPSGSEKDHKLHESTTFTPKTDERLPVTTQPSEDSSKYPSEIEKDHKPDGSTTFKPDTDEKVPVTTQATDDISKHPSEFEEDHKPGESTTVEPETDVKETATTQASDDISKYPSELEKDHKLDELTTIEPETDEKATVTTQASDDISKYPSELEKDHKLDELSTIEPETDEIATVTTQASDDVSKYPSEIEKDHKPDESTTFKPDTDEKVPVTTQASDDVSKYPSELEKDHKLDELSTIEPETDEKATVTTQASDDISKYPSELEKDHKLDELTTIEPETDEKATVTTQASDDISKYPSELEKDHKLDELTTIEPETDEKVTVTTQAYDDISKYPSGLEKDHKPDESTTFTPKTDEKLLVTTQASEDISKYPSEFEKDHKPGESTTFAPKTDEKVTDSLSTTPPEHERIDQTTLEIDFEHKQTISPEKTTSDTVEQGTMNPTIESEIVKKPDIESTEKTTDFEKEYSTSVSIDDNNVISETTLRYEEKTESSVPIDISKHSTPEQIQDIDEKLTTPAYTDHHTEQPGVTLVSSSSETKEDKEVTSTLTPFEYPAETEDHSTPEPQKHHVKDHTTERSDDKLPIYPTSLPIEDSEHGTTDKLEDEHIKETTSIMTEYTVEHIETSTSKGTDDVKGTSITTQYPGEHEQIGTSKRTEDDELTITTIVPIKHGEEPIEISTADINEDTIAALSTLEPINEHTETSTPKVTKENEEPNVTTKEKDIGTTSRPVETTEHQYIAPSTVDEKDVSDIPLIPTDHEESSTAETIDEKDISITTQGTEDKYVEYSTTISSQEIVKPIDIDKSIESSTAFEDQPSSTDYPHPHKTFEHTTIPIISEDNEIVEEPTSKPDDEKLYKPTSSPNYDDITTLFSENGPKDKDENEIDKDVYTLRPTTEEPDKGLNTIPIEPIEEEQLSTVATSQTKQPDDTKHDGDKSTKLHSATEQPIIPQEDLLKTTTSDFVTYEPDIHDSTPSHIDTETEKIPVTPLQELDKSTSPAEISVDSSTISPAVEEVTTKETIYDESDKTTHSEVTVPKEDITTEVPVTDFKEHTTTSDVITGKPEVNEIDQELIPTTSPPRTIPGEGSCLVEGVTYSNNSAIPSTNKCQSTCKCMSSIVKCEPIHCSPPPDNMINCQPIYDAAESCCPAYICDQPRETIPPQVHNQMAVSEPTHVKEDCGENCHLPSKEADNKCGEKGCDEVIEDEIIPVKTTGLCNSDNCALPEDKISDTTSATTQNADITVSTQSDSKDSDIQCKEGECVPVVPSKEICNEENGCDTKPIEVSTEKSCDGEDCKAASENPEIISIPQTTPSLADSSVSDKDEDCTEENGCKKSTKDTECKDDSCIQKPDESIEKECSEPECKGHAPVTEIVTSIVTEAYSKEIGDITTPSIVEEMSTHKDIEKIITTERSLESDEKQTTTSVYEVSKAEHDTKPSEHNVESEFTTARSVTTTLESKITTESQEEISKETWYPELEQTLSTDKIHTDSDIKHTTLPEDKFTVPPESQTTMTLESKATDFPFTERSTEYPHKDIESKYQTDKTYTEKDEPSDDKRTDAAVPVTEVSVAETSKQDMEVTESAHTTLSSVSIDSENTVTPEIVSILPQTDISVGGEHINITPEESDTDSTTAHYSPYTDSIHTEIPDHGIEKLTKSPDHEFTTSNIIDLHEGTKVLVTEETPKDEKEFTISSVTSEKYAEKTTTLPESVTSHEITTQYSVELEEHPHHPDHEKTEEGLITTEFPDESKKTESPEHIHETTVGSLGTEEATEIRHTDGYNGLETSSTSSPDIIHSSQYIDDELNTVVPDLDTNKDKDKSSSTQHPEFTTGIIHEQTQRAEITTGQSVTTEIVPGTKKTDITEHEEAVTPTSDIEFIKTTVTDTDSIDKDFSTTPDQKHEYTTPVVVETTDNVVPDVHSSTEKETTELSNKIEDHFEPGSDMPKTTPASEKIPIKPTDMPDSEPDLVQTTAKEIEAQTETTEDLSRSTSQRPYDKETPVTEIEKVDDEVTTSSSIYKHTVPMEEHLTTKSEHEEPSTSEPSYSVTENKDLLQVHGETTPRILTTLSELITSEEVTTAKEVSEDTTKHDFKIQQTSTESQDTISKIPTTISEQITPEISSTIKDVLEHTTKHISDSDMYELPTTITSHDIVTSVPSKDLTTEKSITDSHTIKDLIHVEVTTHVPLDKIEGDDVHKPESIATTEHEVEMEPSVGETTLSSEPNLPTKEEPISATEQQPTETHVTPSEEDIAKHTTISSEPTKYDVEKTTTVPISESSELITPESIKPVESVTQTTEGQRTTITDKPSVDELPSPDEDTDHQFPTSGTSGYGQENEYDEDQPFGPGTCRYGGKVYVSAQQIPRDDPCDFCFCFRSDIICLQQSCPPPIHGCHEEPIQGFCCPRYECPVAMATTLNMTTTTTTTTTTLPPHFPSHAYKGAAQRKGCQIKGQSYQVGEVVRSSSGPCLHCTCGGDGQMKCDPKVCTPEPLLRQMIAAAVSSKRRR